MTKKTTLAVRVSSEIEERIKKGARERFAGRTGDYIAYLQEFYDMQHLDDLPTRLTRAANYGFNLQQIAHFSVLRTIVDSIANRLGIR